MRSTLIIHSSAAVSRGVRVRNQVVFALSWVLWGAMLLQLVRGIGQRSAATAQQLYTHWIDPQTAPALGGIPVSLIALVAVLTVLLGWSQYQRRRFRLARIEAAVTNQAASLSHDYHCPIEVVSFYFGVSPRCLRILQQARNVVIHHHADGRVAAIRPGNRAHKAQQGPVRALA